MKRTKLKGFTLLEMLIVMIIIGILAVVLCESYITISKIALRIEQQKNLSEESLVLTQIFQSISDEATIDYEKYNGKLNTSNGYTDVLHLTGGQWSGTSIYTTGDNCINLEGNFLANEDGTYPDYSEDVKNASGCKLILEKDGDITPLTSQGKVITSKVVFKVIPYDSDENYFKSSESVVINHIHQPAFWVFMRLYAPLYQPIGTNKIDQPLQLFFNLNA